MTLYIIIVTCIVSFIAFQNQDTMGRLIFNAVAVIERGEWWRFITSGFVHANFLHLAFNMFTLYSFGPLVEEGYSSVFDTGAAYKYLVLYFGSMVIAMLPSYQKHRHDPSYNSLGASGAVSGVVFAYILFAPLQPMCFYGVLCLPGVVMGLAFLAISYYLSKREGGNINHSAHLWGAIFGIAYTLILKPSLFTYFISQIADRLSR